MPESRTLWRENMKGGVLGPLLLESDSGTMTIRAAKPRQVLALLLTRSNSVVSMSELTEELWGLNPPRSAVVTLQTYIVQLRKVIAKLMLTHQNEAKKVLATAFGGYVLHMPAENVDLELFRAKARRGTAALMAGQNHVATAELTEALHLWRGPALVDVRRGALLDAHVTRFSHYRLEIIEQRIEAGLRLGRHQALLSELSELTSEHPLNENLHAKYILALYRSGQRWKALSVFGDVRRALIDELGLGPSPNLTRLHHAVLNADPALDPPDETPKLSLVDELIGAGGRSAPVDAARD
jgi:SARP family transcriptional regulator, regulator of embCAB operon